MSEQTRGKLEMNSARGFGVYAPQGSIDYGVGLGYLFMLIGTVALRASHRGPEGLSGKAIFSLDRLSPIVQLDENAQGNRGRAAGGVNIDEFRIAHVQRSDDCIETTWNNMSNPGAFGVAGSEEQESGDGEPRPLAGAGAVGCLMG